MKAKPTEGKPTLDAFTRTMQALFRVPKSDVAEDSRKQKLPKKQAKKPN
jgi:hypothetical protein